MRAQGNACFPVLRAAFHCSSYREASLEITRKEVKDGM
jgi:hypothetical protein